MRKSSLRMHVQRARDANARAVTLDRPVSLCSFSINLHRTCRLPSDCHKYMYFEGPSYRTIQ